MNELKTIHDGYNLKFRVISTISYLKKDKKEVSRECANEILKSKT